MGMVLLLVGTSSRAERVTVEYEAEASSVVNQPFGMVVPLLTTVRGFFTYETNTLDTTPADVMRGNFLLAGTWDFRAEFLGRVVTGSGAAKATTNLFGSPTLRFMDGDEHAEAGIMSLDSVPGAGIGLSFSISGAAKDLPTDQLPRNFTFNPPPNGATHTFVLSDASGRMLLQFRSFRQVAMAITSIVKTGDSVSILWSSVQGKRYALQFSTNLTNWSTIRNDLVGAALTTTVVDNLAQRYIEVPLPLTGFYRFLDQGPPLAGP